MDLNLDKSQSDVQDAFGTLFAREVPLSRVRQAEPLGFDPALWTLVAAAGVTSLAVPESSGGGGGDLVDLALVAEQAGRRLAPVPLIEAAVATRLLARYSQRAPGVLTSALAGDSVITLALRPADNNVCRMVPAGAIADSMLALAGGDLVLARLTDPSGRAVLTNLGSAPLADCHAADVIAVLDHGDSARAALETAVDEWRVLTASALTGLAAAAHEMTRRHVLTRRVFGNVLGSFQTVAHRLADGVVAVDGAGFLSREAAWLCSSGLSGAPGFAAAALAYASEVSQKVAADCLHLHGGLGYTLEHDAQLYFRRAKAWPLVLADPAHEYLRVADAIWPRAQEL
jgi:alkylation response protein AidB-like acyl-CoA dehydrogenase